MSLRTVLYSGHVKLVALLHIVCGPINFSNCATVPNAYQILTYVPMFYISIEWSRNVFQLNSHLCVHVVKYMNVKYILSLSSELLKVCSYDFLLTSNDPWTDAFFKSPLVHAVWHACSIVVDYYVLTEWVRQVLLGLPWFSPGWSLQLCFLLHIIQLYVDNAQRSLLISVK